MGDGLHYHYGYYQDNSTSFEEAQLQAIRNFYPYIVPGSHVLDAGCGWGGPAQLLTHDLGCKVKGVTISNTQYEYCQKLGLDVVLDDLETMKFKGLSFDAIIMIESLEHITNKQRLFQKAREISPKIILRTNCVSNLLGAARGKPDTSFLKLETPEVICRRLEKAGWRIKSVTNRRNKAGLTQVHWQQRLKTAFNGSPPEGQLRVLSDLCEHSLSNPAKWAKACPLMDIVAE